MKTLKRRSLPDQIKYNGKTLIMSWRLSAMINQRKKIPKFKPMIQINVLSRNLEGKTDLHGQLYKPTKWIYIEDAHNVNNKA